MPGPAVVELPALLLPAAARARASAARAMAARLSPSGTVGAADAEAADAVAPPAPPRVIPLPEDKRIRGPAGHDVNLPVRGDRNKVLLQQQQACHKGRTTHLQMLGHGGVQVQMIHAHKHHLKGTGWGYGVGA